MLSPLLEQVFTVKLYTTRVVASLITPAHRTMSLHATQMMRWLCVWESFFFFFLRNIPEKLVVLLFRVDLPPEPGGGGWAASMNEKCGKVPGNYKPLHRAFYNCMQPMTILR